MNDCKQCLICLESDNELIEYNHCGKYYVHNSCLNSWSVNECLICRKKFTLMISDHNTESENENIIDIENINNSRELIQRSTINEQNSYSFQRFRFNCNRCFLLFIFWNFAISFVYLIIHWQEYNLRLD